MHMIRTVEYVEQRRYVGLVCDKLCSDYWKYEGYEEEWQLRRIYVDEVDMRYMWFGCWVS